jgi:hypothetical protein
MRIQSKYISLLLSLNFVLANLLFADSFQDSHIFTIESLEQLPKSQPAKTIYFFDLDDTIFDSPYMLGSKAWRKYIQEATKNESENWHDIFTLFVAKNHPVSTVEAKTKQIVQDLQSNGFAVFGLTARERNIWYDMPMNGVDLLTVKQLASVGIQFDNCSIKSLTHLKNNAEYFQGIFFADIEPKGEYIFKLFKSAPQLPEKVIFIDDKLSQVESVASALNQLGIAYECYWYKITDQKAQKFNPLIANIQLYNLWISANKKILSDEEAALIAKQHPEKDSNYYLHELLKTAKAQLFEKETSCSKKQF